MKLEKVAETSSVNFSAYGEPPHNRVAEPTCDRPRLTDTGRGFLRRNDRGVFGFKLFRGHVAQ